jgi:hypothetical protein
MKLWKKLVPAAVLAAGAMAMAPVASASSGASPPAVGSGPVKVYLPVRGAAKTSAPVRDLGSGKLAYHGGPVQADPRVYLVFWGPWWKSSCANQKGNGGADQSYLINFFHGRGTSTDQLSAVLDQYHGPGTTHTSFNGQVLYGTAVDCNNPPASATQDQLASVAVAYANYFKAHGQPINANTQIVIVSQHGTNPGGGFGSSYCAWHSWATDGSLALSYTNDPYMPDAGSSCGANYIRSPLDGWSIVGGHEFAESVNDPQLSAWWDAAGYEIGDKCAWTNIYVQSLTTGQYAEQPEWSNGRNACRDTP